MILLITRSGGLAGMSMTKTIDTASLPVDQQKEIESLLQTKDLKPKSNPTQIPDTFTYVISLEGETNQNIKVSESDLSNKQKQILHKLWQPA